MGTTITVRLDVETERLVERVARLRKQSKSQVIRDAITALAKQEAPPAGPRRYEAITHLIGCVRGGPSDLSRRTGERFRRLLLERERRRG